MKVRTYWLKFEYISYCHCRCFVQKHQRIIHLFRYKCLLTNTNQFFNADTSVYKNIMLHNIVPELLLYVSDVITNTFWRGFRNITLHKCHLDRLVTTKAIMFTLLLQLVNVDLLKFRQFISFSFPSETDRQTDRERERWGLFIPPVRVTGII